MLPATLAAPWQAAASAYLVAVEKRTGSSPTPVECARYLRRFFHLVEDPVLTTLTQVHSFVYGRVPSGKDPSPSTVNVRLADV
jgi:hypothetical protein